MSVRLPSPQNSAHELKDLRADSRVAAAARVLCRRLGLGDATLFESGSLPVFAAGDAHVLKLYPPAFAHEADHEQNVLEHLQGKLPIATPAVVAAGEVDGWRYVVMERIAGVPLENVWPSLSRCDQVRLAGDIGRWLAALHALDPGNVDTTAAKVGITAWPQFIREQAARCADLHVSRGLSAAWAAQIPSFLQRAGVDPVERPSLLHTEIMRAHVLVQQDASGWSPSGVIDFEPAMLGAPEYEFASVGIFLTCGNGNALRALLVAYGYRESDLDLPLQRRFLAYLLLHRYSNLRWCMERLPAPRNATTLDALAARWYAVDGEPEIDSRS
jgi:hygromycin-B 7''-O-kinase